jgi:hypothetical protein
LSRFDSGSRRDVNRSVIDYARSNFLVWQLRALRLSALVTFLGDLNANFDFLKELAASIRI